MGLTRLRICNFRIINQANFEPVDGLNLFVGANASGKTSLLEAIDCLSRGRSFRSRNPSVLINNGARALTVSGEVVDHIGDRLPMGLEISRKGRQMRLAAQDQHSIQALAAALPVQVMHPQSHRLVGGSPASRRAFIDWGVFHVKHSYTRQWRQLHRILKQRNLALCASAAERDVTAWDRVLIPVAESVNRARREYVERLSVLCHPISERLLPGTRLSVAYRQGWDERFTLQEALQRGLNQDRKAGHTSAGPHRADLAIMLDDRTARDFASRGQQKLVAATLLLAQLKLFNTSTDQQSVFLVDDMAAELDTERRSWLMSLLAESQAQVFVTTLDHALIDLTDWKIRRVFHVEHGEIAELL